MRLGQPAGNQPVENLDWYLPDVTVCREHLIIRDGGNDPLALGDSEVHALFWREYWRQADAAGYHPAVVHIAPEAYDWFEYTDTMKD